MNNATLPSGGEDVTSLGLPRDGVETLENTAVLTEMQKAFSKIDAMKQGKEPEEESNADAASEESLETPEPEETSAAEAEKQKEGHEEPSSPSVSEEEQPKKKKRKDSLWDIKREKYALLEEKEALSQENLRLRTMLEDSVYRGTYHYGKSAYAALDKAIADKKRAMEEGDTDALIQADRSLIKAERAVEDLEAWLEAEKQKTEAMEKTASSPEKPVKPQFSPTQIALAQDWMKEHPDLNPALPSYQLDKAQQVAAFVNHLDAYIAQNNLQHTSFSAPYFETIDTFIADLERSASKVSIPKTIPATTSAPSVAGVRNTYGASSPEKRKMEVVLSADEKRMARNAGIPEKEWLKYKIDDMRKP